MGKSNYSQCMEYIGDLGIQRTKRGEYIVRDPADRELSRHRSLWNARRAAKAIIAEQQRRQRIAEQRRKNDQAFQRQYSDLRQRQIAWRKARNEVYQGLKDLEHQLRLLRRELAVRGNSWKADYDYNEAPLRRRYNELVNLYYGAITELDTQLKMAWHEHNAKKIASLLSRTDELLRRAEALIW